SPRIWQVAPTSNGRLVTTRLAATEPHGITKDRHRKTSGLTPIPGRLPTVASHSRDTAHHDVQQPGAEQVVRALAARRKIQHVVVSTPDEGTTATSAAEASGMASRLDAALAPLWPLLYVPIRWISDGAVEPELERPLEYLELVFL